MLFLLGNVANPLWVTVVDKYNYSGDRRPTPLLELQISHPKLLP
jgi:hypothetical protein